MNEAKRIYFSETGKDQFEGPEYIAWLEKRVSAGYVGYGTGGGANVDVDVGFSKLKFIKDPENHSRGP